MIQILKYGEVPSEEIFARVVPTVDVAGIVADIIANVRARGDAALYEYCEKFDKAKLDTLLVSAEEIAEARAAVEPRFIEILEEAAENIQKLGLHGSHGSLDLLLGNLQGAELCLVELFAVFKQSLVAVCLNIFYNC